MQKRNRIMVLLTIFAIVVAFSAPVQADDAQKININTASVEELVKLKRVGPKYAEKIVAYREANGPFETPRDILNVQGIGEKTFEVNKDIIAVE